MRMENIYLNRISNDGAICSKLIASKVLLLFMQLSIFAITIPFPHTPGDLHQKFAPNPGLLHPSFCPGGRDLLGQLSRGRHLSVNDVCPFWNFHYNGKNLATDNNLGFSCCSKILYVFKENYSTLD